MAEWLVWLALLLVGAAVGAYGTLIGAGGGFVLVPLLLVLYPDLPHEVVTAISLGVVSANALSGSSAYARQRRIDFRAGGIFAAATIPGAIVGALATERLNAEEFEVTFALVLIAVATWLVVPKPSRVVVSPAPARFLRRQLTDADGDTYLYAFDPWLGVGLGLGIGVVASLFGVGGGIFLVPAMVLLLRFPSHIATATSTFVLVFTAGTGALVHLFAGDYAGVGGDEISLAVGVLGGAQLGAVLSRRLAHHQELIARLFSAALLAAGLRILLGALL